MSDQTPLHHHEEEAAPAAPLAPKAGFLPIETNAFDRVFIAVVAWVALSLAWLRWVEPLGLSVWIAVAISLVLGTHIVRKG